jgi:2-dehydro-3-deoxyphosphogluconate aldolase / (4S)-4-hydroxy-2-oxoglutarate aldolase
MATKNIVAAIMAQGMLPLYFNSDEAISVGVLRAIYSAGVRAVEYTNRGDAASKNFRKLVEVKNAEMPEMLLGVGTVKNLNDARDYVAAGADFLVSPGLVLEMADFALAHDVFYAPGCMTPSEIIAAENKGLRFIKLFPGDLLGPKYVSSIKDIFPKLLFMPTGGVDTSRENIAAWFEAGVVAVGMGSKLISKKLMEQKDFSAIENLTRDVLKTIQSVKK